MRTASLLTVFVTAKALMLVGHHVPLSLWTPIAYLWQDAAVVLVFALLEYWGRSHRRLAWAVYGVAAAYVAGNVPVARVLSTPLTWPMLRAARGPLADSITYYFTWSNALCFTVVLGLAIVAPRLLCGAAKAPFVAALGAAVALGPVAAERVDTRGFDRNAWTALLPSPSSWRRTAAGAPNLTYRQGLALSHAEELSQYRGAAAGRNIVLISLESTAAQYLGLYGAEPDVMPNLSALARSAIIFDHAYAVYPESIKGLFSILCSTYPAFASSAEQYATVPCPSLAAQLAAAGYRTALFHSGRFAYLGMEAVIHNRGFDVLEDAGDIGGRHQSSFGVDEPSTVARMLEWIDHLPRGQRFFLTYLPIAGHHPYATPQPGPYPDADQFGRYRNALHYGDVSLGALVEGIRVRGMERETLWVILGDHGEAFGQHDGNYGHTFQLYEENVRVPFLMAAPGLLAHQVRTSEVTSLIDTAPTIFDLVGVHAPGRIQGRSMLDGDARMALFFADYSLGMLGLRDGPRKFIYELNSGRERLFDLERDPGEKKDMAGEFQQTSQWYRQNLEQWSAAQKRLLRAASTR